MKRPSRANRKTAPIVTTVGVLSAAAITFGIAFDTRTPKQPTPPELLLRTTGLSLPLSKNRGHTSQEPEQASKSLDDKLKSMREELLKRKREREREREQQATNPAPEKLQQQQQPQQQTKPSGKKPPGAKGSAHKRRSGRITCLDWAW